VVYPKCSKGPSVSTAKPTDASVVTVPIPALNVSQDTILKIINASTARRIVKLATMLPKCATSAPQDPGLRMESVLPVTSPTARTVMETHVLNVREAIG
jgi:hypothetical protein